MCFFSKSSRYLVSVNPVANLLRISAVPAVFSVSSVFHQVYEVFYSRIEQCRLLHTFSGSEFPTQFLNFSSNFKNPAYKFQISAQISNFRTNFWYRRRNFTALLTPRFHYNGSSPPTFWCCDQDFASPLCHLEVRHCHTEVVVATVALTIDST